MNFQQLITMIPVLEQVDSSCMSQTIDCSAGSHVLIVVLRGHITISTKEQASHVITQGFACHPQYGPFYIQIPKTKEAEYVVISYRMLPENNSWTLNGPLRTLSEVKIKYMLDELIRTIHEIHTHSPEEEAAQQFRKRLLMERILFIYIYETNMRQEDKSSAISMEESLSYINEHYMLKLTLPMLAERAGMSIGHYTVLFKSHAGKTMTGYLRSLRIDKAKEMFLQTQLPAKEIAQRVGFVDYFHFSRIFKQEVGYSSGRYL
ncbi:helix-turn-helix domain-containing protein [Paenibacillus sp. LMG 31456]|uniref:Helix-turn-helix domain-containing protein n=1 Tax=Paenibacillus foliorum TaxID=2654974 RepID=A0A972GXG5_9BACL|nr:AraC family transcriptional regulator [Paenibacillus foliorum]NOU94665.1 helix-turn-helix domain-containing protein [Paenibacillus foliorum]